MLEFGNHYMALAVKDIAASKEFYEKLGFTTDPNCGGIEQKWLILQHGAVTIGLYQDMFPNNIMTFNPPDARKIQADIKDKGLKIDTEADAGGSGPCHFILTDPDGNTIMFDQHFPTPSPEDEQ